MTTYCIDCRRIEPVRAHRPARQINQAPLAAAINATLACGHRKSLITTWRQVEQAARPMPPKRVEAAP